MSLDSSKFNFIKLIFRWITSLLDYLGTLIINDLKLSFLHI
jgi:hypothetical protein